MPIDHKLIDSLLKDYKTPEDILGENGLLKQLTKAVLERAMRAELTQHLGYEPHDSAGDNSGNSRNGKSRKTLKGDFGELPIEVPCLVLAYLQMTFLSYRFFRFSFG